MDATHEILKKYWGYDSFRPLQPEAIRCVLDRRDSVVVLPTGGGKSVCYQVPALAMDGMAVIVSPLISLMKDQVDALRANGVSAASIHSMLTPEERRAAADGIKSGAIKVVYVSPERLAMPDFIEYLKRFTISFIAIDEAHCISHWGHDFRPEYRALRALKDHFPGIAIHAFTATATQQVRADIAEQLGLAEPEVIVGNFDRPNLMFRVERRGDEFEQLCGVVKRHPGESGIVYCISRKKVDDIAARLQDAGLKALPYHAGLSDDDRRKNQDAFIREDVDIVVATVAFGMGIDKSNVRYVVHLGMPKSLEHYQQECGRAGRDGLEAECCLFHSGSDFMIWKKMLSGDNEEGSRVALRKLNDMMNYCSAAKCRHRALVEYFGQRYEEENCGACGVCLGEIDAPQEVRKKSKTEGASWDGVDKDLFERLRALRKSMADERSVPAFVIFSDASLRDMAKKRPTNLNGFLLVSGVGRKKCDEFGDAFVAEIRRHCESSGVAADVRASQAPVAAAPRPKPTNKTARDAFQLFEMGRSVSEAAEHLGRAESTMYQYLEDYVRDRELTDPHPWVDSELFARVRDAVKAVGPGALKPVFLHLNEEVPYNQIRIVMACMRNGEPA